MWWFIASLVIPYWGINTLRCFFEAKRKIIDTFGDSAWRGSSKRKALRRSVLWFLPHRFVFPMHAHRQRLLQAMKQEAKNDGQ
jgi:hypothetical protein